MNYVLFALTDTAKPIGMMTNCLLLSVLICLFFISLNWVARDRLASNSKHSLLLSCFFCIAMLPFFSLLAISNAPPGSSANIALVTFSVIPEPEPLNIIAASAALPWHLMLLAVYFIPTIFLLLKLIRSILALRNTQRFFEECPDPEIQQTLDRMKTSLAIQRPVSVNCLDKLPSPMTYGFFHPQILIPIQAANWSSRIIEDVIVHELCHIKRHDWITQIGCFVVAALFWANPLIWSVLKRLSEESELSCDQDVMRAGQSPAQYAESLLEVARNSHGISQNVATTQMMPGKSNLPGRIHQILEDKMTLNQSRKSFLFLLAMLTASILAACAETRVLSSESQQRPPPRANHESREVILPITAIAPQYPLRAAVGGIEGWALVEFTVLENGDVDPDSLQVVDAEPPEIFNNSSIRAARRFKFETVGSQGPRAIDGVQYLFRYDLGETDTSAAINRELEPVAMSQPAFPAAAREQNLAEGSVWTVFHVTREGEVKDVDVRYSSNDIFNEPAIEAARNLRFTPRPTGAVLTGAVEGDTTGLVRAQYLFRFEEDV